MDSSPKVRPRGYFWKVRQAVSVHFSVMGLPKARGPRAPNPMGMLSASS